MAVSSPSPSLTSPLTNLEYPIDDHAVPKLLIPPPNGTLMDPKDLPYNYPLTPPTNPLAKTQWEEALRKAPTHLVSMLMSSSLPASSSLPPSSSLSPSSRPHTPSLHPSPYGSRPASSERYASTSTSIIYPSSASSVGLRKLGNEGNLGGARGERRGGERRGENSGNAMMNSSTPSSSFQQQTANRPSFLAAPPPAAATSAWLPYHKSPEQVFLDPNNLFKGGEGRGGEGEGGEGGEGRNGEKGKSEAEPNDHQHLMHFYSNGRIQVVNQHIPTDNITAVAPVSTSNALRMAAAAPAPKFRFQTANPLQSNDVFSQHVVTDSSSAFINTNTSLATHSNSNSNNINTTTTTTTTNNNNNNNNNIDVFPGTTTTTITPDAITNNDPSSNSPHAMEVGVGALAAAEAAALAATEGMNPQDVNLHFVVKYHQENPHILALMADPLTGIGSGFGGGSSGGGGGDGDGGIGGGKERGSSHYQRAFPSNSISNSNSNSTPNPPSSSILLVGSTHAPNSASFHHHRLEKQRAFAQVATSHTASMSTSHQPPSAAAAMNMNMNMNMPLLSTTTAGQMNMTAASLQRRQRQSLSANQNKSLRMGGKSMDIAYIESTCSPWDRFNSVSIREASSLGHHYRPLVVSGHGAPSPELMPSVPAPDASVAGQAWEQRLGRSKLLR
eukprot:CAMPEP_0175051998 /NCGR_PEP_ID=MMETSP0052_2-20121109/8118_1 /TAXON_ID=51329 ORGANISM="Polytomella parva, Strain SAG 63-3" /NCGR_SAMPLE_ID=MMETSP0052_2 /ASSEMBLY_ACC=CAM_ASM_000194 /LENGTH=669 /DNA_ID=CAMNT_0016316359 /DNA_START=225 /DNA_END=2230 /DNA_ORIENTATION=-